MKTRNKFILKQIQECIYKPKILRMMQLSRARTNLKRWCNWSFYPKTGSNESLEENERNWTTTQDIWSSAKMNTLTWEKHFHSSLRKMPTDRPRLPLDHKHSFDEQVQIHKFSTSRWVTILTIWRFTYGEGSHSYSMSERHRKTG